MPSIKAFTKASKALFRVVAEGGAGVLLLSQFHPQLLRRQMVPEKTVPAILI